MTPGTTVGRYELVRPLGRGGMGEVWEACLLGPRGFRKPVALKLLHEGPRAGDEDALVEEARIGALLHHPNLVAVHELGVDDGRWYLAMELVRGRSVSSLLAAGALPASLVVEIGQQVCHALAHVHAASPDGAGLVHRDVKPANVLVDASGLVKLADLGLVALAGTAGRVGAGTPGYAAPEQVRGDAQDARTDVFSLGATLFAMAARRPPFGSGRTALDAVARVDEALADAAFLAPVETAVPGLAAVVRRCLRADPAERFGGALELQAALAALRERQTPAPPLAALVGGVPESRPSPSRGSSATTVLLPGNLPERVDRFFGRTEEVEELGALLVAGTRTIGVLGLGGAGKTRLAIETLRRSAVEFAGGAWFVDASDARSADELCRALGSVLGVPLEPADPVGQLGRALRGRGRIAVILDNLEQVADAARACVGAWAAAAPEATLVYTSRVALGLRGERRVHPGPLALADGIALFVDRAGSAIPPEHQDAVADVVRAVEGHPLAIELAASRVRLLPVPELVRRLSDRLRVLAGGSSDAPDRHRSLRAALDGSWELLSPRARATLAAATVFVGGFTIEAAEAVVRLGRGEGWVLDGLQELAEHSLVRADPSTGRLSLGEVVREYAAERLDAPARLAAEVRHAGWYARLGESALAVFSGRPTLEPELDNLVAAARRAHGHGQRETAAHAALAAWAALLQRGPYALGRELLLLVRDPLEEPLRARVDQAIGEVAWLMGRTEEARVLLAEVVERHRARGDRVREGAAMSALGLVLRDLARSPEARDALEGALARAREAGDPYREAVVLLNLGPLEEQVGNDAEAERLYERVIGLGRRLGSTTVEATGLASLGRLRHERGRKAEARVALEEAVARMRAVGDLDGEGRALGTLGNLALQEGRLDDAAALIGRALSLLRRTGRRRSEAIVLGSLGTVHLHQGEHDRARACFEGALALHEEADNRRSAAIVRVNLASLDLAEGRPDQARALLATAFRAFEELAYPRGTGAAWLQLADVELACGDAVAAERALAAAGPLLESAGDLVLLGHHQAAVARAARLRGDAVAAGEALARAEALAARTSAGPGSPLGLDIARARGATEAGP